MVINQIIGQGKTGLKSCVIRKFSQVSTQSCEKRTSIITTSIKAEVLAVYWSGAFRFVLTKSHSLPNKFTPTPDCNSCEIAKRSSTQTKQASVCMINVQVHYSTIRIGLNKHGFFEEVTKRKPLLPKTNMAAHLRLAKLHLNKPQEF